MNQQQRKYAAERVKDLAQAQIDKINESADLANKKLDRPNYKKVVAANLKKLNKADLLKILTDSICQNGAVNSVTDTRWAQGKGRVEFYRGEILGQFEVQWSSEMERQSPIYPYRNARGESKSQDSDSILHDLNAEQLRQLWWEFNLKDKNIRARARTAVKTIDNMKRTTIDAIMLHGAEKASLAIAKFSRDIEKIKF